MRWPCLDKVSKERENDNIFCRYINDHNLRHPQPETVNNIVIYTFMSAEKPYLYNKAPQPLATACWNVKIVWGPIVPSAPGPCILGREWKNIFSLNIYACQL